MVRHLLSSAVHNSANKRFAISSNQCSKIRELVISNRGEKRKKDGLIVFNEEVYSKVNHFE